MGDRRLSHLAGANQPGKRRVDGSNSHEERLICTEGIQTGASDGAASLNKAVWISNSKLVFPPERILFKVHYSIFSSRALTMRSEHSQISMRLKKRHLRRRSVADIPIFSASTGQKVAG
jgi:hypothetical protein